MPHDRHSKGAVLKFVARVGKACAQFHDEKVRAVRARRLQADEAWSFCYAKAKTLPEEKRDVFGYGDVWTWVAIDAQSKLCICPARSERAAPLLGERLTAYLPAKKSK